MKPESRLRGFPLWGILFVLLQWQATSGFLVLPRGQRPAPALKAENQDDTEKLIEKAQKLREEAQALESKLRSERPAAAPEPVEKPVQFQQVPGSTWAITYRFAEEPVKDRDEDAEPLEFFRGQLNLLFRTDGYTELISEETNENGVKVQKVWGWDEELSQEDGKRYVLFSMDATTPNDKQKQRFYFQALLEEERNEIFLKGGTVTIKRDLAETKKMMGFGLFNAQGILAQFRYVGDFTAKPIQVES